MLRYSGSSRQNKTSCGKVIVSKTKMMAVFIAVVIDSEWNRVGPYAEEKDEFTSLASLLMFIGYILECDDLTLDLLLQRQK